MTHTDLRGFRGKQRRVCGAWGAGVYASWPLRPLSVRIICVSFPGRAGLACRISEEGVAKKVISPAILRLGLPMLPTPSDPSAQETSTRRRGPQRGTIRQAAHEDPAGYQAAKSAPGALMMP